MRITATATATDNRNSRKYPAIECFRTPQKSPAISNDAGLFRCRVSCSWSLPTAPSFRPPRAGFFIPEVPMSVEAELTWLRLMSQILREDVIVDQLRVTS